VVVPTDPPHPDAARRLAGWLTGRELRRVVSAFSRERGGPGSPLLFRPVDGPSGREVGAGARPGGSADAGPGRPGGVQP